MTRVRRPVRPALENLIIILRAGGRRKRRTSTRLDVPAYFLIGRHDINASVPLCEEYVSLFRAPAKELVHFERSGHNPWSTEPELFVREVLRLAGME